MPRIGQPESPRPGRALMTRTVAAPSESDESESAAALTRSATGSASGTVIVLGLGQARLVAVTRGPRHRGPGWRPGLGGLGRARVAEPPGLPDGPAVLNSENRPARVCHSESPPRIRGTDGAAAGAREDQWKK
jgi:hypothetical protein